MNTRPKENIDYKLLNDFGIKKVKDQDQELSNLFEKSLVITMPISVELKVMKDEIIDFIDENGYVGLDDDNVDEIIKNLENLRRPFRMEIAKIKHESNVDIDDLQQYENTLQNIKLFIMNAKDYKQKLKLSKKVQQSTAAEFKDKSTMFAVEEVKRISMEVHDELHRDFAPATDEEIRRYDKESTELVRKLDLLSKKLQDLLGNPSDNKDILAELEKVKVNYAYLLSLKTPYLEKLQSEMSSREINKYDLLKEAQLKIKLEKFSGYQSLLDVYSFQSMFEKIYLRTTPSRVLPDLLKNNFLSDPALSLVKGIDDINEIWKRLKEAYGDTKIMLNKKLEKIFCIEPLGKIKDPEKLVTALSKLINLIQDVMNLAEKHDVEPHLYYSDAIEKIYKIMGESRLTRWFNSICEEDIDTMEKWPKLVSYLEKEMKVQQQKMLLNPSKTLPSEKSLEKTTPRYKTFVTSEVPSKPICYICGDESNHAVTTGPNGSNVIQYFSCKLFTEMTPYERLIILKEKGLCFQCLLPGAKASDDKHKNGKCQRQFVCPNENHKFFRMKRHILVCDDHKACAENKETLENYRSKCILRHSNVPNFSKDIKLSFYSMPETTLFDETKSYPSVQQKPNVSENGIYMLQNVLIDNQSYLMFYDSGCSDFVVRHKAIESLGARALKLYDGEINIGGIGDCETKAAHGLYNVNIPSHNGANVLFSGVCMDKITHTLPNYPLDVVEQEIYKSYIESSKDPNYFPKCEKVVGGDVDMMVGIKYLRFHPKLIFQLPSGLSIYESNFRNSNGGRGIIGGPHKIFTQINHQFFNGLKPINFFTNQYKLYKVGYQVNPDLALLGYKMNYQDENQTSGYQSSKVQSFNDVENTGTEISYRCVKCRTCKDCKNHDSNEIISTKEEVEQHLINSSVKIDTKTKTTVATLPFIGNPLVKLCPNKDRALKVYYQQLKKLNHPDKIKDKADVIASEQKLQQLGYVDYTKNLPINVQIKLRDHQIKNYIPWRAVFKDSSVSTPCRIVYDASQATATGFSLNDILAKGKNNLNKLQEILIRWSVYPVALHSDIRKMYNTIKLDENHWCYQRYIWQEALDPSKIPDEKVIKTLIYGVRPSGNQAEYALRKVAESSKESVPEVNQMIQKDMYVDDCISGAESHEKAVYLSEQLESVINKGGFQLKGVTFSGEDPPASLSDDGISINVGGYKWFPKDDELALNIGELNFSRKLKGRRLDKNKTFIPDRLTRRQCTAKIGEIFDITGKVTPLVASMKLDLHELIRRKLDWDDKIPDDLRQIWESNFQMMEEIKTLRFNRAVIPKEAVSLDLETIDMGDASKQLICIAIYARFELTDGNYSCQLIFSRSKLVPEDMSQPRAELFAALTNTYTGEIVKKSFYKWHKNSIKMTDSQITLYWISNDNKPLKTWVRNRVIEINRFTTPDQWYYIPTKQMVADIGTRKGATINDINKDSIWINGLPWMKRNQSEFPTKTVNELRLDDAAKAEIRKETPGKILEPQLYINNKIKSSKYFEEVSKRYAFSNYIIDPNKFRFHKVVRILAYVMKFIRVIKRNSQTKFENHRGMNLSDAEINLSQNYFFQKSTAETIKFQQRQKYEKFTVMKDGILLYSGRILNTDDTTITGKFTNAMLDLHSNSFAVPVIEKYSPVAMAIINDVHWYSTVKHSGIETIHREVLKKAYIIEARYIIKLLRITCQRCRYLQKKCVEISMGPVSKHNLMIAPPFFVTQTDLSGPYNAYPPYNKRGTVKIWLSVFCCATTGTTEIKVMEDYSSNSFILAFIRFSSNVGFPKTLLCDSGSQIVKSCQEMRLNFVDLQNKLSHQFSINFEVCPVGGHNFNGKVERRIRHINDSISKCLENQRLSILQWETLVSQISNSINDLPLALKNYTSDFETMDILTPNRLRLGRNNQRSPVAEMVVTDSYSKIIAQNECIFTAWFSNWLQNYVPKLIQQPKWFVSDDMIQIGDVVLFLKNESQLSNHYQYGMVDEIMNSSDNKVRKVVIRYKNNHEQTFRKTTRSTRQLVVIHHIDDVNINLELGIAANECKR